LPTFFVLIMDAGDAVPVNSATDGQGGEDKRPTGPANASAAYEHHLISPAPPVASDSANPQLAGASIAHAAVPHQVRMDACYAAAVASADVNPDNGVPYGRRRAGKRPAKPALGPSYSVPTPPPTNMERAIKNNMRAQNLAAALVAADGSTEMDDRDFIGDYGTQGVYDLEHYYGPTPPPTPMPTPPQTGALNAPSMFSGIQQTLSPVQYGLNEAAASVAGGSQPRPGPPALAKRSTKGKSIAKVSKWKAAPRIAARAKAAALRAASRSVEGDDLHDKLQQLTVPQSTTTPGAASSAPPAPAAPSASTPTASPSAAPGRRSPAGGCRPPIAPRANPPSPPPPGTGPKLSPGAGARQTTDCGVGTSTGNCAAPAATSGVGNVAANSPKQGSSDLLKVVKKAVMETNVPLANALQGVARTAFELSKESAGTLNKLDTLSVSHERLARAIIKVEQAQASVDEKLTAVVSMIKALDTSDESGMESTDSDGDSTMGRNKKSKGRKSRKKTNRDRKAKAALGFKNMEKVRRVFRRMLMDHIAKTNKTKLVYPDMAATWDILVQASQEALTLTTQLAKDFLMDFILVPTRADPTEAVSKRASVPLLRVKPHLLQALKERTIAVFLRALGLSKAEMTAVLAGKWLDLNAYMQSAMGFQAILAAVKEFFIFLGAADRIIISDSVGTTEVVECALGHFALVSCLVRSFLETVAGVRSGRRNGVGEGMVEYWVEEVGRVDSFLPCHTAVHDGLRLLDGDDVARATFEDDDELMMEGIVV